MKRINDLISITLVVLFSLVVVIFFYERHYLSKYDETQINVDFSILEKSWGKPDKVLEYGNGDKTVFYNTILNEFVFNINDKNEVILKYNDNF
ncbi:MAG TPA: hypothetical protein VKY36_07630 [Moheibacter sp.]|nr:hypothetical protein [Moheibacter sp.]